MGIIYLGVSLSDFIWKSQQVPTGNPRFFSEHPSGIPFENRSDVASVNPPEIRSGNPLPGNFSWESSSSSICTSPEVLSRDPLEVSSENILPRRSF